MLIAYLDEFGHVGPYIEDGHPKYGHHPVFGYAGYVLPAHQARRIGSVFRQAKTSLFKTEIDESKTPHQWERKGSDYFSTGSINKRPEQIRVFNSLVGELRKVDGHLFYYGDEKVRGTLKQTGVESNRIAAQALKQTIDRLCTHADRANQELLILTDAITDKTRQELVAETYAHIYGRRRVEMKRIIEAPLHIESKLNSGIQFADWICALVARASHFQLVEGSAFGWASEHFRSSVFGAFTLESKLHLLHGKEIHHSEVLGSTSSRHAPRADETIGSRIPNMHEIYEASHRARARTT